MNRFITFLLILGASGSLGSPLQTPFSSSDLLHKSSKFLATSEQAPNILGKDGDDGDDFEGERAKRSTLIPLVVFENGESKMILHDDGSAVILGEDDSEKDTNVESRRKRSFNDDFFSDFVSFDEGEFGEPVHEFQKREAPSIPEGRDANQKAITPLVVFENGEPKLVQRDDGSAVILREDSDEVANEPSRAKRSFNDDFFSDFVSFDEGEFGEPVHEFQKREAPSIPEGRDANQKDIIPLVVFENGESKLVQRDDGSAVILGEDSDEDPNGESRTKRSDDSSFEDMELGEPIRDLQRREAALDQPRRVANQKAIIPLVVFENGESKLVQRDDGSAVILGEDSDEVANEPSRAKRSFNDDFFSDFVSFDDAESHDLHKRDTRAEESAIDIPIVAFENGEPVELTKDDGTPLVYEHKTRQKRDFGGDFFNDFVEFGGGDHDFSLGSPDFHRIKREANTIESARGIPLVVFQDGQLQVVKKSDGTPLTIEEAEDLGQSSRSKRSPRRKRKGKTGRVNYTITEHVFVLKPVHHGHHGHQSHHGYGHGGHGHGDHDGHFF